MCSSRFLRPKSDATSRPSSNAPVVGKDGEAEASKVIREVVEKVVLHPVGQSRNRHTAPPKIEIVGRLEALIGQRVLFPMAVGGV